MYYIVEKDKHLFDTFKFLGIESLQNAKNLAEHFKVQTGKQYDIVHVETVYTTQTLDEAHLEATDVPHMARD
jgi:hypothetical protein